MLFQRRLLNFCQILDFKGLHLLNKSIVVMFPLFNYILVSFNKLLCRFLQGLVGSLQSFVLFLQILKRCFQMSNLALKFVS